MRFDIVTIFPEFFGALDVSLLGKARQAGVIEVGLHDLRDFTHDRHRTVDDTPYGGGAGMVMKPEPWGEALDSVVREDSVIVVPSPAGHPFTQRESAHPDVPAWQAPYPEARARTGAWPWRSDCLWSL